MVLELLGEYEAHLIASRAETERLDTYQDNIEQYRSQNFSYIPLPEDGKYYDVNAEELRDLHEQQVLRDDTHLVWAMSLLLESPFLLIDYHGLKSDHSDLAERLGIERDPSERYGIITLADIDTRLVKNMLYPAVSTFEHELANLVRNQFPESELPEGLLRDKVRESWEAAKAKDVETHVVEHMYLSDLIDTVAEVEFLRKACGFGSKSQVSKTLGGVVRLRDQVMHPPRPIADDQQSLDKTLDRLGRIQEVLKNVERSEDRTK